MARSLALSLLALALAGPAALAAGPQPVPPRGRIMGAQFTCTTIGDALGGLEITAAGGALTVVESTMEGSKKTVKGTATHEQVQALVQGKGANFIIKSKKSNEFGGAVSDATLLVVGDRDPRTKKRSAWMARTGIVYVMHCQG